MARNLLAKKVLQGKTKGYIRHPQMIRFKAVENPLESIDYYLSEIFKESQNRGFSFDRSKIDGGFNNS